MQRFTGTLTSVRGGGHVVAIPPATAEAVGLRHGVRVRGTVNGVGYRSSLMKSAGQFHLGVHKATIEAAGAESGAPVDVAIEIDDQPLPTDKVPPDLAKAIGKSAATKAAWAALAPSHKREHVKHVIEAKKPETRAKRIASTLELLRATPKRSSARGAASRGAARRA
jgi:hypothetical protein